MKEAHYQSVPAKIPGYLELFEANALKLKNKVLFRQAFPKHWQNYTWTQAHTEILQLAQALTSFGFEPQSRIGILSKNCPHWIMADIGIWQAGHISVPIFPSFNATSMKKVIEHSGVRAIFVGKLDAGTFKNLEGIDPSIKLITFPDWPQPTACQNWEDFMRQSAGFERRPWHVPSDETIATIIYTSGTTGHPKGIVHSFRSVNYSAFAARTSLFNTPRDKFFSYLPLCHVTERALVELGGVSSGAEISFVDSLQSLARNLFETQPDVFLAVPRVWARFRDSILAKMPQAKLDRLLAIPIVRGIIQRKIKKKLGLGRARWIATGGSAISPGMVEWFKKLGIQIREGYGLTENLAIGHFALAKVVKTGSVGRSLLGVQTRISPEGEIQLKSPASMLGYFKEPEATAAAFADGYLRTGDKGSLDEDNFLRISGRIKELFKVSCGKYVAPAPIEESLLQSDLFENVCVIGQGMDTPVVIVRLSTDAQKKTTNPEFHKHVGHELKRVNSSLEAHEKIGLAYVAKDDWTIENGILTPTMKIRRNEVEKRYLNLVEKTLGTSKQKIIFESDAV